MYLAGGHIADLWLPVLNKNRRNGELHVAVQFVPEGHDPRSMSSAMERSNFLYIFVKRRRAA